MTPKSMVLDPGWFNRDRTKFEDWWRGIRLFLKSNKVVAIDELKDEEDTQDWEEFVKEIKTAFSNKSKVADTE